MYAELLAKFPFLQAYIKDRADVADWGIPGEAHVWTSGSAGHGGAGEHASSSGAASSSSVPAPGSLAAAASSGAAAASSGSASSTAGPSAKPVVLTEEEVDDVYTVLRHKRDEFHIGEDRARGDFFQVRRASQTESV